MKSFSSKDTHFINYQVIIHFVLYIFIFSKTSKMKQSRYFIAAILLLVAFMCIVCNSCANSYNLDKTKEFVNKHGEDDFSIFYGVNPMFYRGRQDSLYLLGGIIPRQQGEIDSWAATGIYYNINDCTIVKIRRSREGWTDSTYASIDSTYINNLTRRFVELDIYEIYMNTDGTIRIQIDEHPQSCVVRFDNDSIMKIYSKDCKWNCISANWYIPQ